MWPSIFSERVKKLGYGDPWPEIPDTYTWTTRTLMSFKPRRMRGRPRVLPRLKPIRLEPIHLTLTYEEVPCQY